MPRGSVVTSGQGFGIRPISQVGHTELTKGGFAGGVSE